MEGDGCGDSLSECIDSETLWECGNRVWALVDCTEVCADQGGAVGCLAGDIAGHGARCWCANFAPTCAPGTARCFSDDEIEICRADTLQFAASPCDDVCAALTPPNASNGCVDGECQCSTEGTPCAPETPPHCEQDAIATCVDGLWTLEFCGGSCPPGSNSCDPFAPGGAACACENA